MFLQCFFPGDSTTYPQGAVVDGGVDGSGVPIELSFDSFSDPGVQKLVRDAYGEGGRCWRIEGTSTEISDSCTRACASALADECQRGAAGAALCPDVVVDGGFQAGDQAMTCAQVGAP